MLDIKSLVLVIAETYLVQALILFLMAKYINMYRSIRFWAFGSMLLCFGFICLFLRSYGRFENELVLLTNAFQVGGILLFYVGTKRMMNISVKNNYAIWFSITYLSLTVLFTYIVENMDIRIILFSVAICILTFRIANILMKHSTKANKQTAKLLAGVFYGITAIMALRVLATICFPFNCNNFFQGNFINDFTFLIGSGLGFFWAIGIIVLKNQTLNTELLERSNELLKSNSDKDKLLSILAHDLRGPINTLSSFTDILVDPTNNIQADKLRAIQLSMQRTAHSASILIDNLLDWSRIQQNIHPFFPQTLVYNDFMSEVMSILLSSAESKNIQIIDNILPSTELIGDRRMVQSIFRNVLANAIKFTPKNGEITLSTEITANGKTVFCVQDTGIGMDDELLASLFDRKSNNNRIGTNGESSTGLGLILCMDFVEKHGGRLWATSKTGQGSTFHFTLQHGCISKND
jgi:signal transduction histidine kinase